MKSLEALENWYNTQSPRTKAYEYEHHYRLIKKDLEVLEQLKENIRIDIEMVNILKALKKGIIYGDREVNVCLQNVEVDDSYTDEIRIYHKLALVDIECGDVYELEDYNKKWFIKGE